jgi:hypothetical protein
VQNVLPSRLLSKNIKIKVYRTIILPVVLFGCETWSVTLREEHLLRVFENRVLRRIFWTKRDEVAGEWRRLHQEEVNALYLSPNIIRVIKSRRMRWEGHDEEEICIQDLVDRPEGRRRLGRSRPRCEDNIKMGLKEVGWRAWTGLVWLRVGTGCGLLSMW